MSDILYHDPRHPDGDDLAVPFSVLQERVTNSFDDEYVKGTDGQYYRIDVILTLIPARPGEEERAERLYEEAREQTLAQFDDLDFEDDDGPDVDEDDEPTGWLPLAPKFR